MSPRRSVTTCLALLAAACAPITLAAQADSGRAAAVRDSAIRSAAAQAAQRPPVVSGTVFGYYGFQPSTTPAAPTNQADNAFLVERAYLTVRANAGERTSVRITTDIFQSRDSSSNAYTVRAKYAYLQYDGQRFSNGVAVMGRLGIVQNVLLESQEVFWPRYLSQAPTEKAGYFSSADVGLASQVTLPGQLGEVFATIVNGPGYTSRERDRFKDYGLRLTLTPLAARSAMSPLMRSLTLTAWGYKGATASRFVNGGAGQVGEVGDALDRSRAGLFAGIRDPRFTLAAEVARRSDGREEGLNTTISPRTSGTVSGELLSAFTVIRPVAFLTGAASSPFGVIARYDHVSPSTSSSNLTTAPATKDSYHNFIGGLFYDLSSRAQLALDYQESLASDNDVSLAPPAQMKGWFAHFTVSF